MSKLADDVPIFKGALKKANNETRQRSIELLLQRYQNRHVVCKLAHKLAPPTTKWLGVRFKVGGAYLNFKNELEIEKIT